MTSRRFDSTEYLEDWRHGRWPEIHDELVSLVVRTAQGRTLLDLCCSTGLLGARVSALTGCDVYGVDVDRKALDAADAADVPGARLLMGISPATLPALTDQIAAWGVTGIIARRCLPELLTRDDALDDDWAREFFTGLRSAGIDSWWLQGRAVSSRTKNALGSLEAEVRALRSHLHDVELVTRTRTCALLRGPSHDRLQSPV